MARTGRFGRQPRSAPSLTNTLVAIAREFQNQRAQNIMDAWQKGGEFEGQKATDEVVLKFWKNKAAGVSKDDPLYDTYKNAHTQLDYTIHESKMTAAYALGKKNDAQMVQFYLGWAKKVPKNSEFYRVLQRDAGQYMRRTRANGEAEARRRAEELYQRQQNETRQKKEAAGEYAIDLLRRVAQSGYADGGIAPAINAPGSGSDLTDFDPSDPDLMLRLLSAIKPGTMDGPKGEESLTYGGNKDVIFHDDDGKGWTGEMILGEFAKLDPKYKPGAPFNTAYITGLLDQQMQGLNERISRANKTGHMSDVTSLQKGKEYVSLLNREVAAYPVQRAYMDARADWDEAKNDISMSPQAMMNAWNKYQSTLLKLAGDPRIEADDNMRSRLTAEANMQGGAPTLYESFTGLAGANGDQSNDSASNAAAIKYFETSIESVKSGAAAWTYGQMNGNGVFEPVAGGRMIGAATIDQIDGGGTNRQEVTVPDPRGGPPLTMLITAVPVYATATDPRTGEPVSTTNSKPVAYAYDVPKGSGKTTMYGFNTKEGFMFSSNPPWKDSLKVTGSSNGGNHLNVDLSPVLNDMALAQGGDIRRDADGDFQNGFSVQGAKAAGPKGGEAREGTLFMNMETALWMTDDRKGTGQPDPGSDFSSLTLGLLMTDADGEQIVTNLDKNPAFQQQVARDNARYAGMVQDEKGAWVPGPNADQSKAQRAMNQTAAASSMDSIADFFGKAATMWSKFVTGSPMKGDSAESKTTQGGFASGFSALPTDMLQGTPFEALGGAFIPGSSVIKDTRSEAAGIAMQVKPVGVIKAPAMPVVKGPTITQGPTPAGTSPYTLPTNTQGTSAPPPTNQQGTSGAPGQPLPPPTKPGTAPTPY